MKWTLQIGFIYDSVLHQHVKEGIKAALDLMNDMPVAIRLLDPPSKSHGNKFQPA